ncbi:MAG TPA: class I SAM-dependent methyltransferase [Conexibacter sp.]|nr:class I SAM-dependent methyltransferase [Conexibacter sp.]
MDVVEVQAMLDHEDRHWWYRGRRRIVQDELAQLPVPPDARVLDAGCGSGRLLDELTVYGSVSGLDMNPDSVEVARGRGHADVQQGAVESLPWEDETFDLITSLDVIEHTADDRVSMRELRRVLAPGGRLLITVPAYKALWSSHDVFNRHYRRYDRRMMRSLAADVDLRIERMTYFNSLLLPPAAVVRWLQRPRLRSAEAAVANGNDAHRSDVELTPQWLSPTLELALRLEGAWLRGGERVIPAGLSLLAVLRR